jgi:hypothetical protein
MAESAFSRRMMAQKLMTDARPDPFSDSRFFAGKMRPSMADINQPTTLADARAPAATASLFAPGAGIADVMGYAPDPMQAGQMLPSFGANVRQGNYLDAGLQTLGVAGDVLQAGGAFVPPLAAVGTALKAPRAARVALSPEITRAISRNTDRNAKKVAKDLRQEGLLDVNDRGQSEAFYAEFERIRELQNQRTAAKPDPVDNLERNQSVRSLKADKLKAQKPIKESPMFNAWTKPNRERVLNSTYDSDTIDAEARLATVEAIAREAKKRGLEVYYTSKGQRGRAGSRYIELPDGGKVRVSDHELPDTPQRQYTRSQGIGNFADEIIVSDWETSSVDDYLNRILKRPNPNEAAGAAMDAAQARYFETGKFEAPTAENPVSIVKPTETEPGIIAFHGSGADFDEFRLEMIGTGEGAQAYGYGLYFTDSEDIAKFYRDSLARGRSSIVYDGSGVKNARETDSLTDREMILDNIATEMAFFDQKPENVIKKKIKNLKQKIDDPVDISASAGDAEAQELADFIRQSAQRELEIYENLDPSKFTRGKMYKVGLAPKPDELLDYDLPLSQQPKKYKAALDEIAKIQGIPVVDQFGQSASFGSFQDALNQKVGPVNAMKEFTDAGIPGIKFFSGNTRNTAGGKLIDVAETTDGFRAKVAVDNRAGGLGGSGRVVTTSQPYETKQQALDWADEAIKNKESNYVIFDDKAVKILEKYGIVGPVAVTAAGTAAVNRGRNDNDNGGSILPDAGIM